MAKSPLVLVFTLAAALGCTGGRNDDDTAGDGDSGDGDAWYSPDVNCAAGEVEFTADASDSIVAITVEVFDGEDAVEVVDLTHRGAGDWYGITSNDASYDACMNGSAAYFLFVGTTEDGAEIEHGI